MVLTLDNVQWQTLTLVLNPRATLIGQGVSRS
jgi:hypothetical protein